MENNLFQKKYMLGANYWASNAGCFMWQNWDPHIIEEDFKVLKSYGVDTLRVFPLWAVFQPIKIHFGQYGIARDVRMNGSELPKTPEGRAGVDPVMIERFAQFCEIANRYGMNLTVMLLAGWMSGEQFRPEPLQERNVFTDSFALASEIKFVKFFVSRFKNEHSIIAWGFGNESNVMSMCPLREAAFVWSSLISDTIRSQDTSRPIISGMHGLTVESSKNPWHIADQGYACDIVTNHPYPLFTPNCDMDSLDSLRSSLHATAESCLYSDISRKKCFIEEMGDLGRGVASESISKTYLSKVLWSCWSHNHIGCLWWAAFDVPFTNKSPYDWFAFESTLGLFSIDRKPKLMAEAMSQFSEMLASLPQEYRNLPPHNKQAVCVLSGDQDHWPIAFASFILAKQAGFTIRFISPEDEIPSCSLYLLPSLTGISSLSQSRWKTLTEQIYNNGGVLYLSINDALLRI